MKEPCAEMQPMLCKDSARREKRKTNSFDFANFKTAATLQWQ